MGLYRATLNQPGVRAGKVAWFDDNDRDVRRRVMNRFLIPVDQAAIDAQVQIVTVGVEDAKTAQERIREALATARAANEAKEAASAVEAGVSLSANDPESPVEEPEQTVRPSPLVKNRPKNRD